MVLQNKFINFFKYLIITGLVAFNPGCSQLPFQDAESNNELEILAALALLNSQQTYQINFSTSVNDIKVSDACASGAFVVNNLAGGSNTISAKDMRFYISEVSLIDMAGNAVSATIPDLDTWQSNGIALIDLENATNSCAGTSATNPTLQITAPAGSYSGIQFSLGIPLAQNTLDNSTSVSPLNIVALQWNWVKGYKFTRIELNNGLDMSLHIGRSGTCSNVSDCSQPFLSTIKTTHTSGFNPGTDTVALDIDYLLNGFDYTSSAKVCMPNQNSDCSTILSSLGLQSSDGTNLSSQSAFRIIKN